MSGVNVTVLDPCREEAKQSKVAPEVSAFSNLRTAEEELHVEVEKPPDTDEAVVLYQCPDQTTLPILQFYNANPGTTPKPLQPGELDCSHM